MNNSLYNIPGSRFDIVDNSQIANIEVNRQSDCSIVSWAKTNLKSYKIHTIRHIMF